MASLAPAQTENDTGVVAKADQKWDHLTSPDSWDDAILTSHKCKNSDLFELNGPNFVLSCASKYYLEVSNNDKKHGTNLFFTFKGNDYNYLDQIYNPFVHFHNF